MVSPEAVSTLKNVIGAVPTSRNVLPKECHLVFRIGPIIEAVGVPQHVLAPNWKTHGDCTQDLVGNVKGQDLWDSQHVAGPATQAAIHCCWLGWEG